MAHIENYENLIENIQKLSRDIAKYLNSDILNEILTEFPNTQGYPKNFTYMAVLSTSHLVISSYISDREKVLDIDVAWCSGKDIRKSEIEKILEKYLGNVTVEILKYTDYKGNDLLGN